MHTLFYDRIISAKRVLSSIDDRNAGFCELASYRRVWLKALIACEEDP